MPRRAGRPTVATIARDLGISPATVSYALNDKPGVSAATRERVLEHAKEVGWTPNFGAQALRRGQTGNIGLVLVRDPEEVSREPFYSAITAGIESATSDRGRELMLRFVEGGIEDELAVFRTWAEQRRVDGVILLDLAADDPRPGALAELGMPAALIGEPSDAPHSVQVSSPEAEDAAIVVRHLADCGYQACIQLTGPLGYVHERRRLSKLTEHCAAAGIAHQSRESRYTIDGGTDAITRATRDEGLRTAVVASSDLIALGALRGLAASRGRIPAELGVVSWDDSLLTEVASPALTALARDPLGKGRTAGNLLLDLIEGTVEPGTIVRTPTSVLVPRETTARR